ncbi:hypothetical protein K2173_005244 [Erythroxylum novogranatense]|uniref:DUF4283 domain-containing protein n=1 Tax=Erythroxylum novogranatense TaxID=1862640 RepID=A0AAV8TRT2_9ROSI|nr:hypothetical protein K2173_005244 [Erythroxylum novogranatense]
MDQELQSLSIREKENLEFVIPSEAIKHNEVNHDLCLLGKLVGERSINAEALERMLLSLWRPLRGAFIKPMEDSNLYLIQFYHHIDLKKMIAGALGDRGRSTNDNAPMSNSRAKLVSVKRRNSKGGVKSVAEDHTLTREAASRKHREAVKRKIFNILYSWFEKVQRKSL